MHLPPDALRHGMTAYLSDELLCDVAGELLSRQNHADAEALVSALNYYLEHDCFPPQNGKTLPQLDQILRGHQWERGLQVPRGILAEPACDLSLALEMFYRAGGYDYLEENDTAYYVMEFHANGSISDLLHRSGPLREDLAIKYIQQIAYALSYIHEQNTVHLDIKPSNILLNSVGNTVIIDFGTSKHYDSVGDQTSTTPIGYSKGYAPLEQYREGDVSQFQPATDIYALGATFYTLITGRIPPEASVVLEEGLIRPEGMSDKTWRAISKSMMPKRGDRPQCISEFLQLLGDANVVDEYLSVEPKRTVPADSYKILTADGRVRVYQEHGKRWLSIDNERISDYYDDVIINTLVDDCIVCAGRNEKYAYIHFDIESKCIKSTPFKYDFSTALKGKLNCYRDVFIGSLVNGYNQYLSIIDNSHNGEKCLLMLTKHGKSYVLFEQDFNYYPQSPDRESFWILLLGFVIGFSFVGFIAAGIFHFSITIGVIAGFILGIVYFLANKKESVHEAHIEAIGKSFVVLEAPSNIDHSYSRRDSTKLISRSSVSYNKFDSQKEVKIQRRNLSHVNASVFWNNDVPKCDSINEVFCPITEAKGYYQIERNGQIGMRRILDNGVIQELFPFDGKDDLDFEDAWLRLRPCDE